jgi:hypothetical protein
MDTRLIKTTWAKGTKVKTKVHVAHCRRNWENFWRVKLAGRVQSEPETSWMDLGPYPRKEATTSCTIQ